MNARPLTVQELTHLATLAPEEHEARLILLARQKFGGTIAAATPPTPKPKPSALSSVAPPASAGIYIPRATREKLAAPAGEGGRHHQAVAIARSLCSQGMAPEAVLAQLRATYPADVTDRELTAIVAHADAHRGQPCRPGGNGNRPTLSVRPAVTPPSPLTPETMRAHAEAFLAGFSMEEVDVWERSPWRPPEDWRQDAAALLAALYAPEELVNVVVDHFVNADGKACPKGAGVTRTRDEWLAWMGEHGGPPESAAGAWFRPNPVKHTSGTGAGGAYTDADTAAGCFVLVESDKLPLAVQRSILARLPLPIAAVTTSAGGSLHALVRLSDEPDPDAHRARAKALLGRLAPLGMDLANVNPSRLSRLPGAVRRVQADPDGDGRQRLLYLAPAPPTAGVRIL